jgi:hypothetical protein
MMGLSLGGDMPCRGETTRYVLVLDLNSDEANYLERLPLYSLLSFTCFFLLAEDQPTHISLSRSG